MKKILSLVLVLCMVLTLCACGGKSGGSDVTLVYWSMWEATEAQGIALTEAIEAFTKETGIKVDVQFKGRQGIRQGLQAALDAGTAIDVFDEGVDRVLGTWGDYVLDLESYVANGYEANAIPASMSATRQVGGGTLKAIPYQLSIFAWFYNPDIFAEAGVTAVPTTWAEFLDACEKIKAAGYAPVTSDDAYFSSNFGYHVARYGGPEAVADAVMNGNWENNDAIVKTAKDFEEMATKGYFSELLASNVWPNGQNVEFALGSAAMYLNGSWLPNEIKPLAGEDYVWGCFSYPAMEGGKNDTSWSNTSFQVFAINKKSAHPDEAFKLIEWLTTGEWDLRLSELSLGVPADTRNTEWPAQMANVKPVVDGCANRYEWAVGAENNPDITAILNDNLRKLAGGTITADEFVAAMQSAANG